MNQQLTKVSSLGTKPERNIIGLMSGTSLDGLDICHVQFSGQKENITMEINAFRSYEFPGDLKKSLESVRSRPQWDAATITMLHKTFGIYCAEKVKSFIEEFFPKKAAPDLIGSHGQTIWHEPPGSLQPEAATLQIGDADHIAALTGIPVIFDFRQKHIAAGGEGAPLARYFDEYFFRSQNQTRFLLNIGGIANVTLLPPKDSSKTVTSTDTGPGNTLINEAIEHYFNQPYDKNGDIARKGNVHEPLLEYLLLEPFFRKEYPKTTGQELFNLPMIENLMHGYGIECTPEDLIATLTALTARSIAKAISEISNYDDTAELVISGGGSFNSTLIAMLKEELSGMNFKNPSDYYPGLTAENKEAALIAFLADAFIQGRKFKMVEKSVSLGKLSLPD